MGYLNDTGFSQFIAPILALTSAGTWSGAYNSNIIYRVRTAADSSFDMMLPILVPSNSRMDKGSKLKSVEFIYYITTASPDAFAELDVWKNTFASDGTPTATAVPITLDAAHDTDAERIALGYHRAVLTLTTPVWIDNDEIFYVHALVDCAATTVFRIYGAIANYTMRA